MRRLILWCGLAAALGPATAQTPTKPTVTAEATEVVKAKPDTARLTFSVAVRNADADTATADNDSLTQQFAEGLAKLKLAGVKATPDPLRIDRVELSNNRGGGLGVPDYNAVRAVVVTVTDPDPVKLVTQTEKVQREAAKLGVGGELGPSSYNGVGYERSGGVKVAYSRADAGWDEATAVAIGKATKRAIQKAEALGAGAGLKLGDLVSVDEVSADAHRGGTALSTTGFNGGVLNPGVSTDTLDTFVDGELIRKVRVKVVFTTK
jgi:uncharacterized protein YggE